MNDIKISKPVMKNLNTEPLGKIPISQKFLPATPYFVHFLSKVIQKIIKISLYTRQYDSRYFPSASAIRMPSSTAHKILEHVRDV